MLNFLDYWNEKVPWHLKFILEINVKFVGWISIVFCVENECETTSIARRLCHPAKVKRLSSEAHTKPKQRDIHATKVLQWVGRKKWLKLGCPAHSWEAFICSLYCFPSCKLHWNFTCFSFHFPNNILKMRPYYFFFLFKAYLRIILTFLRFLNSPHTHEHNTRF